jgi:hypothetical protein
VVGTVETTGQDQPLSTIDFVPQPERPYLHIGERPAKSRS